MRDGEVVAHDPTIEELQANPRVHAGDDVFPIGEPPAGFYLINV